MNAVDLVLALVVLVAAVRGYARGFIREAFGLVALLGGLFVSFLFAPVAEALVASRFVLPDPIGAGVAFVGLFVGVYIVCNIVGVLFDRGGVGPVLRVITDLAGAALGSGKAVTVAASVLLFVHLFPVAPALEQSVMASTLGRPIVSVAERVVRVGSSGWDFAKNPGES